MPSYPVDIEPEQVVRWIMQERRVDPKRFRIEARRGVELRNIPERKELHLGDEEREDLSEIDTVATLEIAPAHTAEGWVLTVVVEDEAGPRLPDTGDLSSGEEVIDLHTFYKEFIRPGRGIAYVVADVQDDAAETRLNELLESIEENRHAASAARDGGATP